MEEHDNSIVERLHAEQQVEAFIEILQKRYNIREEDIPSLIDDIRWIAEHRQTVSKSTTVALFTLIGLIVTGLVTTFIEGLKHFFVGNG